MHTFIRGFPSPQTCLKRALLAFVFVCLLAFSILGIFFLYQPSPSRQMQMESYRTEFMTAIPVNCVYPASGQYGRPLKYSFYVLTIAVVLLRHHEWLAAGAAVTVMTYAGVAAIHAIRFAIQCNRLNQPKSHSRCYYFPAIGLPNGLPICAGIYDPDYDEANIIVGAGLLAALPMAKWSKTFYKKPAREACLLVWLLLLAVGHVCYLFTVTNPNRHYQTCPAGIMQPLPNSNYSPISIDNKMVNETLSKITRGLGTTCFTSCFVSPYSGRSSNNIVVYGGPDMEVDQYSGYRALGIAFWLIYATLAFVAIIAGRWSPQRYRQPDTTGPDHTRSMCKTLQDFIGNVRNGGILFYFRDKTKIEVVEFAIRIISACSFLAFILYCEYQDRNQIFEESFSAVGQWGAIAAIFMVILAAVLIRVMDTGAIVHAD